MGLIKDYIRLSFIFMLFSLGAFQLIAQDKLAEPDSLAKYYFEEGMKKIRARSYDSADQFFLKARPLYETNDNWYGYVKCQNELALILLNIEDTPRPAIDLLHATLEKTKDKFDTLPEVIAITHDFLAGGYSYLGDYDASLYHDQKAIETAMLTLGENDRRLALSHNNIANTYYGKRNYKQAIYHAQKSIAINQKLEKRMKQLEALSYSILLNVYKNTNDVEKVKEYIPLNLILFHEAYDSISISMSNKFSDIVAPFILIKQYDTALYYQRKSLDILSKWPDKYWANRRNGFTNMANIYRHLGNYDSSLVYLDRAEKIAEKEKHTHPNVLAVYNFKTAILDSLKRHKDAEQHFAKYGDFLLKHFGTDTSRVASYYVYLGNHYRFVKDYDKALLNYQKGLSHTVSNDITNNIINNVMALPDPGEIKHHKGAFYAISEKSRTLFDMLRENPDDELTQTTIDHLQNALALIDILKKQQPTEGSRSRLYEENVDLSQALVTCLLGKYGKTNETQILEKALAITQRSQSQRLRESLNSSEARVFTGIPESLTQLEFQANTDIAFYQQKLEGLYSRKGEPNKEKIKIWTTKIADNRSRIDSIKREIERSYATYYELKYQNDFPDIASLQAKLKNNSHALINYIWCDSIIFVLALTKDQVHIEQIPTKGSLIEKIQAFRNVLDHKRGRSDAATGIQTFSKLSYELYQILLQPTVIFFNGKINRLTIIPDNWLAWVPFEILISQPRTESDDFKDLHYSITDFTLNYAYSAALWQKRTDEQQNWEEVFVGFAPAYRVAELKKAPQLVAYASYRDEMAPLAYATEEVIKAGNLFNGKTFIHQQASEAHFKSSIGKYQIVHLAMHALVDEEKPLQSKMIFSQIPDSTEDGFLHAYELYNTRLNADLAVLSACNTGFGSLAKGEGVMSLSRAFAYAGCKSVVMSLWPAQDQATAEIMTYFYEGLNNGYEKDQALRDAKLKYLENADDLVVHPFYWAGFVVSGDVGQLSQPTPWFKYGFGLFVTMGFIWIGYRLIKLKQ